MLWIIFGVVLVIYLYISTRKPKNFPPGPPRLPLIGSLPFLQGSGAKASLLHGVDDLFKKHGPIVGFYVGRHPTVAIADFDLLKVACKNDLLSGRLDVRPYNENRPGWALMDEENMTRAPGVVFSQGAYWKETRRFLLRHLRDFGFGKSSMEELLQEEVQKLCQALSKTTNEPMDVTGVFNVSIINSLWSIIVGEKFELNDPELKMIVNQVNEFFLRVGLLSPIVSILPHPSLAKLPILRKLVNLDFTRESVDNIVSLISPKVKQHEETLDEDNCRDLIDAMLVESRKALPGSSFAGDLGQSTIINSLLDMFIAGMETTSSSLVILILHMLHHPKVQEDVHRELDEVIGKNRPPTLSDQENLPYVNAVLHESLRCASFAFFSVFHCASQETQIGGYNLPRDCLVIPSLYHVMNDPKVFPDPFTFKPDRFISKEGKFTPNDHVIPFGVGKRSCLGQTLAEKEFFLFFTGLLQQFQIFQEPGQSLPSYTEIYPHGLTRNPEPFKVVFKKRI